MSNYQSDNEIELQFLDTTDKPFLIVNKPSGLPSAPLNASDSKNGLMMAAERFPEILKVKGKKEIEFITADDGLCAGAKCEDGFLDCKTLKNMFSLRSDAFEVEKTDIGYDFTCYGYGHGVGMSQKGANLLAKQGFDYCEILKYYYSGIKFDFII